MLIIPMTTMYAIYINELKCSVMSWNWTQILPSGGLNLIIWTRTQRKFRASSWVRMPQSMALSAQHGIKMSRSNKMCYFVICHFMSMGYMGISSPYGFTPSCCWGSSKNNASGCWLWYWVIFSESVDCSCGHFIFILGVNTDMGEFLLLMQ